MATSIVSATEGGPIPSPTGCFSNNGPDLLDLRGLSGQVCQINVLPELVNIQPCCNDDAELRIQDGCTQYCETDDDENFVNCVRDLFESPPNFGLGSLCQDISDEENWNATASETRTLTLSSDRGGSSTGILTTIITESGAGSVSTIKPTKTGTGDDSEETDSPTDEPTGTDSGSVPEETGTPEETEGDAAGNFGRYSLSLAALAVTMAVGIVGWL